MSEALMLAGGWDGHEPQQVSELFGGILADQLLGARRAVVLGGMLSVIFTDYLQFILLSAGLLVTSGLGGAFPSGYPVAVLVSLFQFRQNRSRTQPVHRYDRRSCPDLRPGRLHWETRVRGF